MNDYLNGLKEITDSAKFLSQLDVIDINFHSGHKLEVYVANTPEQRTRGLAHLDTIDTDGMLFYYDKATYRPYSVVDMRFDIDLAWYDKAGKLIDIQTCVAGDLRPVTAKRDYLYVIESPVGMIPHSDMKVV